MTDSEDGFVNVDVEMPEPMLELVKHAKRDDQDVEEFIVAAVMQHVNFALRTREPFEATVDVSDEAAEFARLNAETARLLGREDVDERDYVADFINLRYTFPDERKD